MTKSSSNSDVQFPSSLFNMLENLFDDIDNAASTSLRRTSPAVNFLEAGDHFRYELAAPGLQKKDFKVELKDGTLIISTEKPEEKAGFEEHYHRKEFSYHAFRRSFDLPKTADPNAVKAKYERGVLTITLSKRKEAQIASRKIEIS